MPSDAQLSTPTCPRSAGPSCPGFHIREGLPGDAVRLAILASQVWLDTYAVDGISNDFANYVLSEFTPGNFEAALGDPGTCFILAERGDNIAAFARVAFSAACPAKGCSTSELETLYVQERFTRQGLGQALLHAAEAKAWERSGLPLWLTVNANNQRAVTFYQRRGYVRVGRTHFVLGTERHANHVLLGPVG